MTLNLGMVALILLGVGLPAAKGNDFRLMASQAIEASSVSALAFAGPGTELVYVSDGTRVLAQRTGEPSTVRTLWTSTARITSMAGSFDGAAAVVGTEDGRITFVPILAAGSPRTLSGHRGQVTATAMATLPALAVSAGLDKRIVVWDAQAGLELRRLPNPANQPFTFLSISEDAGRVLGVTTRGAIVEWNPQSGLVMRQWSDPDTTIHAAAVSTAREYLAIASERLALLKQNPFIPAHPSQLHRENRIKIYDLSSGLVVKTLDGMPGEVTALTFTPDSRYLAALRQAQTRCQMVVLDAERGSEVAALPAALGVRALAFDATGGQLGMVAADRGLRVMQVEGVHAAQTSANLAGGKFILPRGKQQPLLDFSAPVSVAVIEFDNPSQNPDLGRSAANRVEAQIAGTSNLVLVERSQVEKHILKEQNFGLSARTDPNTAAALGRVIGAKKMILGRVSLEGTLYAVTVRLVDVETAAIDGVREVHCLRCRPEDLPGAIGLLRTVLVKQDSRP